MRSINLLAGLLVATALGCTSQKSPIAGVTKKFKPSQVVQNQFVFGGNKANVAQYLQSQGIEATFTTLSAEDGFYQVHYKGDASLEKIVADLSGKTDFVEPNYRVELNSVLRKAEWPTDKLFFKQWALNNIGQAAPYGLPGVAGADMDVLKVWDKVTTGSSDVIVALIDTGCDYTHPDLKPNIWVNEKESEANGGIPGKDDDGNGYIDDVYGYDFVSSDRTSVDGFPGDEDPMDDQGHGTHCAGSIGAVPNNGIGISGLNAKVKIMCVRFLGDGGGTSVDSFRAIRYARINGAHIMSNSWGGGASDSELFKSELRKVQDAGILFVAAAGNDGTNNDIDPHYPSNYAHEEFRGKYYDNVISVAASDNQDAAADFSNYGHETVDIFAPGVAIVSTYPQGLTAPGRQPYATMSGTSMATPYVAAVAALMMAANPSLKNHAAEVKRILLETVDVKPTLIGKVASNGRVNAYRAVTAQTAGPKAPLNWISKANAINQRGFNKELVDIRHEIKVDGAQAVKVHFDFIQVQAPYDSIYLYDKDFRLISTIEKDMVDDFWSPVVPGDTVHVRFVNSLLQRVEMMPIETSTESACISRGATDVQKIGDAKYTCQVDSDDSSIVPDGGSGKSSSGGGSKTYTSFNSEGFSIDQVAYVTEGFNGIAEANKEKE